MSVCGKDARRGDRLGARKGLPASSIPRPRCERFYRIVMAIYKKMAYYQPHSSAAADRAAAARRTR